MTPSTISLEDNVFGTNSVPWTEAGRSSAIALLSWLDPILGLSHLPQPVRIGWEKPAGNWGAQSSTIWVSLVDSGNTQATKGWEQSLTHELIHIVDRQLLSDSDRNMIWKTLTWDKMIGDIEVKVSWLDEGWYSWHAGEAFAEFYSRHLWYGDHEGIGDIDLDAWGIFTYDPKLLLGASKLAVSAAIARRTVPPSPPKTSPSWKPGDSLPGWSRQPDGHGGTLYVSRTYPESAKPPVGSLPCAVPGYSRVWKKTRWVATRSR